MGALGDLLNFKWPGSEAAPSTWDAGLPDLSEPAAPAAIKIKDTWSGSPAYATQKIIEAVPQPQDIAEIISSDQRYVTRLSDGKRKLLPRAGAERLDKSQFRIEPESVRRVAMKPPAPFLKGTLGEEGALTAFLPDQVDKMRKMGWVPATWEEYNTHATQKEVRARAKEIGAGGVFLKELERGATAGQGVIDISPSRDRLWLGPMTPEREAKERSKAIDAMAEQMVAEEHPVAAFAGAGVSMLGSPAGIGGNIVFGGAKKALQQKLSWFASKGLAQQGVSHLASTVGAGAAVGAAFPVLDMIERRLSQEHLGLDSFLHEIGNVAEGAGFGALLAGVAHVGLNIKGRPFRAIANEPKRMAMLEADLAKFQKKHQGEIDKNPEVQAVLRRAQQAEKNVLRIQREIRIRKAIPDEGATPKPEMPDVGAAVDPGNVRLYRIERSPTAGGTKVPDLVATQPEFHNTVAAEGRWFAQDPAELEFYINHLTGNGLDPRVTFVDLPIAQAEQYRVSKIPSLGGNEVANNPAAFSRRPSQEFFLPPELAAKRSSLDVLAHSPEEIASKLELNERLDLAVGQLLPRPERNRYVVDILDAQGNPVPTKQAKASGSRWLGAKKLGDHMKTLDQTVPPADLIKFAKEEMKRIEDGQMPEDVRMAVRLERGRGADDKAGFYRLQEMADETGRPFFGEEAQAIGAPSAKYQRENLATISDWVKAGGEEAKRWSNARYLVREGTRRAHEREKMEDEFAGVKYSREDAPKAGDRGRVVGREREIKKSFGVAEREPEPRLPPPEPLHDPSQPVELAPKQGPHEYQPDVMHAMWDPAKRTPPTRLEPIKATDDLNDLEGRARAVILSVEQMVDKERASGRRNYMPVGKYKYRYYGAIDRLAQIKQYRSDMVNKTPWRTLIDFALEKVKAGEAKTYAEILEYARRAKIELQGAGVQEEQMAARYLDSMINEVEAIESAIKAVPQSLMRVSAIDRVREIVDKRARLQNTYEYEKAGDDLVEQHQLDDLARKQAGDERAADYVNRDLENARKEVASGAQLAEGLGSYGLPPVEPEMIPGDPNFASFKADVPGPGPGTIEGKGLRRGPLAQLANRLGTIGAHSLGGTAMGYAIGGLPGAGVGLFAHMAFTRFGGQMGVALKKILQGRMHNSGARDTAKLYKETLKKRIGVAFKGTPTDRAKDAVSGFVQKKLGSAPRDMASLVSRATFAQDRDDDPKLAKPHGGTALAEVVRKKAQEIARAVSDLDALDANISELLSPFAEVDPDTAEQAAGFFKQALDYLHQNMPKNPEPPSPFQKHTQWVPNDEEAAGAARRIAAVVDPAGRLLDELESGRVSDETVETVQTLRPDLFNWIRDQVSEALIEAKPGSLGPGMRYALGAVFGISIDPNEAVDFVQAINQYVAKTKEQEDPQQQTGQNGGYMLKMPGSSNATRAQKFGG